MGRMLNVETLKDQWPMLSAQDEGWEKRGIRAFFFPPDGTRRVESAYF